MPQGLVLAHLVSRYYFVSAFVFYGTGLSLCILGINFQYKNGKHEKEILGYFYTRPFTVCNC